MAESGWLVCSKVFIDYRERAKFKSDKNTTSIKHHTFIFTPCEILDAPKSYSTNALSILNENKPTSCSGDV
jgi:hypothetical protein